MKGVKELKEFIVFLASLGTAADKAQADGKLDVADLGLFMPALMKAPEALMGLDEAKLEAKDLSQEEMQELSAAISQELDLRDDVVEGLIEKSLSVAPLVYGIFKEIQAFQKSKKESPEVPA